jgi:hypothetical protein
MTERGACELCEEPVFTYQTAAFPVTGWEIERYGGGANQIKARRRVPNRIVHAHCLERKLGNEKRGVIEGQMEIE